MRRISLFVWIVSIFVISVQAADFEHRQIDVRAQAMGGAFSAVESGVRSIYNNPAGLAASGRELFMTYSDLFGIGFGQNNFAYAQPLFGGGVGVAFEKLSNSEDLFYEVTTLQFSYGKSSKALPFNYGITLRRAALDSEGGKASAICFDLGVSGKKGNLAWGLAIFNCFALANPARKITSAPCDVKLGVAYELPGTLVVGELVNAKEIRLGVERKISDSIALRAGTKDGAPTFGLGLSKGSWQMDYCFELGSLGSTNALGLTRQF